MKKKIEKIGKSLNRNEMKKVNGGVGQYCSPDQTCSGGFCGSSNGRFGLGCYCMAGPYAGLLCPPPGLGS